MFDDLESGAEKNSTEKSGRRGSPADLSALRLDESDRRPQRRRWLLALLLLPLVALAVFLVPGWKPSWNRPEVEVVTVQRVSPTQESTVLTATGYTFARSRAAVGSKIIGRVVDLRVDEGDRIGRGDVIAVLDSDDLRANLRQRQAMLAEAEARRLDAEREETRQRELVRAGVSAQANLDSAVTALAVAAAAVDTAQATIDAIEAQLDYTVIRSPIDGVVIERNVEVGEMVAPGGFTSQQSTGAIVRIADPSSLEVEADVNESYISRISLGMPATIEVDAVPGREYRGALRQIVPTADRQRAVVEVKVSIEDRDERLVPDMSCTVTFLEPGVDAARMNEAPKLMAPSSVVLRQQGVDYVFVVRDETLDKVPVEVVPAEGDRVELRGGVGAGDVLVRAPSAELEAGQRVRLAE